jgi:uncharacterized protein (DUF433 family)
MLHLKNKDLSDYVEYDASTDTIQMKGHRVGLDLILDSYLAGKSMAELQEEFDSLSAEELHAAITYYLLNKDELDRWLEHIHSEVARHMAEVDANPGPASVRIDQLFNQQRDRDGG